MVFARLLKVIRSISLMAAIFFSLAGAMKGVLIRLEWTHTVRAYVVGNDDVFLPTTGMNR